MEPPSPDTAAQAWRGPATNRRREPLGVRALEASGPGRHHASPTIQTAAARKAEMADIAQKQR